MQADVDMYFYCHREVIPAVYDKSTKTLECATKEKRWRALDVPDWVGDVV